MNKISKYKYVREQNSTHAQISQKVETKSYMSLQVNVKNKWTNFSFKIFARKIHRLNHPWSTYLATNHLYLR